MHVLVVEDDNRLAEELVRALRAKGFETELMTNSEGVEAAVVSGAFDLVLLDLTLPGQSGLELLTRLQSRTSVPIVVMSARQDLAARLQSFERGAVDFVPKPFFFAELLQRIDVRLGRRRSATTDVTRWANAEVNGLARTLLVDGTEVTLTHHEMSILLTLIRLSPNATSRQHLVEHALALSGETSGRTVDSHVTRIRQKLGASAAQAIRTVWRIGYRFEPDEK